MKFDVGTDIIYYELKNFIGSDIGASAIVGNLYAESGLTPYNLQNSYARKLKMTDEEYTKAVDYGSYTAFATDKAGYGFAQWTSRARKQNLYGLVKLEHETIGDPCIQLLYLILELNNYSIVLDILKNSKNLRTASDAVLTMYLKPRNQSEANKQRRFEICKEVYDHFTNPHDEFKYAKWGVFGLDELIWESNQLPSAVLKRGSKGAKVRKLQECLLNLGYELKHGADGSFGTETYRAVKKYQKDRQLYSDGIAGSVTRFCIDYEWMGMGR